jgi:PleD family two-component response regulator
MTIEEALSQILADDLLTDCREQLELSLDVDNIRHEKTEIFVNYLLSSLSMISDDIRMLDLPKTTPEEEINSDNDVNITMELVSPGASENSKSILVVNKTKLFLKNLKKALVETGHELIGVTASESAIGYLKNAKPDLFILDDDPPDMDGFELTKRIREMGQAAPIIFLTGNVTKEYMVKGMAAGVADFILKPIATNDVQEKVTRHLLGRA